MLDNPGVQQQIEPGITGLILNEAAGYAAPFHLFVPL
jgi:hypothetical protein